MITKSRVILVIATSLLLGYFYLNKIKPQTTSVSIPTTHHNFGKVTKDQNLKVKFVMINNGNTELEIEKIVPDCDCTVLAWNKVEIAKQDTFNFEIEVNKLKSGFFQQNILVYGNYETSPELFYVQGRID